MASRAPLSPQSPVARLLTASAVLCAILGGFMLARGSAEASVEERLDQTEQKLDRANQKRGVLSSEIEALNGRIRAIETQVAALRVEERAAERRLADKQAELDVAVGERKEACGELRLLAKKLKLSLDTLRSRLVAIYESGTTEVSDLVFASEDYGDLIERSEYIEQIQSSDEKLIARVRDLRDRQKKLVLKLKTVKEQIEKVRDQIAEEEQALQVARTAVQSREQSLVAARGKRSAALSQVDERVGHLESIRADLQAEIQAEIAAASGVSTLPAGPMSAPSAAGLIWPLSGTLTSGFGYRWGRMHEGIDIAVPEGTPVRSAKSGTVIIASYYGGYGNYICVDHGGGLSTCYGHLSGFASSTGQRVSQGQVIGYSGNTGSSTGPHLHFEVRINGAAQDPMGYL
ncbi:MAG: murein hydrolase activator EnvC family protein [Solirubrobacterales bacterium]